MWALHGSGSVVCTCGSLVLSVLLPFPSIPQEQDELFHQYAAECISEYKRQGKSTVPMELHLRRKPGMESAI